MIRKFAALALLASSVAFAAPASAVTFDALTSFTTTQGAGGFSYGSFNGITFTAFSQSGNCALSAVTCLRGSGATTPTVAKATGGQTVSGSVLLPTDQLIGLPGSSTSSVYMAFTTPFAGTYVYSAQFTPLDTRANRSGVSIREFFLPASGPLELYSAGTLLPGGSDVTTGFTLTVNAGDTIGYIIDSDGFAGDDATGFNFRLDADAPAVPEPASWAMMIVGCGIAGGALRRRGVAKTAIA